LFFEDIKKNGSILLGSPLGNIPW